MIILDATTKSLQFKLSATVTANQLPFSASYVDTTGTATNPGEQDGASNNTTAVTVVSSPASSVQRLIKNITIQNADTAAATVTIIYNNNATLRNVLIVTLAVGDQLIYEDGQGWAAIDKNGNLKTASGGSSGGAVTSVSNADGTITINPTTGSVIASLAQAPANTILGNLTGSTGTVAANTLAATAAALGLSLASTSGGFVNKFRNGTMDIWQRGAGSFSVTTAGAYTADGWIVVPTGATCSAAQTTSNPRTGTLSTYSLLITGATSVTDILIKQRIESYIAQQIAGQTVTVQARVYNNTGATINPTLTVKHASAADNWSTTVTDVSAVTLQSCSNAAWTQVAYTFSSSSSSGNGLEITIDFGNNFSTTGKSVQVTELDIRATPGVSTGINSAPPPIELRDVQSQLAFCQRYYQNYQQPPLRGVYNTGVLALRMAMVLPVVMRASPTATMTGNLPVGNGIVVTTISSINTSYCTSSVAEFDVNMTSGTSFSPGQIVVLYQSGTSSLAFTAEL